MRTATKSGCGFPKFSSTWFTAGRYLRWLEVKFSYLRVWVKQEQIFPPLAHLRALKLPTESVPDPRNEGIVSSLANTNISDFAFVNQFFKFLPCGVRVRSHPLVNHDLPPFFKRFLFECDWPVATHLSSLKSAKMYA